jgi:hypothetical protein
MENVESPKKEKRMRDENAFPIISADQSGPADRSLLMHGILTREKLS